MKKYLYSLLLLCLFIVPTLSAQTDSIQIDKKWYGTSFTQEGVYLSYKYLCKTMKETPESKEWMEKAKGYHVASYIFSFSGGFLIGWPIGVSISDGKPNWTMAGIGAGLVAIGFVFEYQYTRHAIKAVNAYNSNLPSVKKDIGFQMGMLDTGIGLRIKF